METLRVLTRTQAVPRTGHEADDALLEVIAQRGEQFATLRWQHHLYLPDEDSARAAAAEVLASSWQVSRIEAMPAPYTGWMLRLARHDVLTPQLVMATREDLEGLAHKHDGHYDGWDALSALPTRSDRTARAHRSVRPRRRFIRHARAAV